MKNRPRMLMCPLCGMEFGSKSLPIHYPQCTKKWLDQEALKPLRERRPLPVLPSSLSDALAGGTLPITPKQVQEFNSQMGYKFENESLEHCNICGRSFNSKAFQKHVNLCTVHNPFKPAGTSLGAQSLSTKLVPGKISGTLHKQASLPPRVHPEELMTTRGHVSAYVRPAATSMPSARGLPAPGESPRKASLSLDTTSQRAAKAAAVSVNAAPALIPKEQLPELPAEVLALADEVCLAAAGEAAAQALRRYLSEQRVLSLTDLQYLQLDWLVAALQPKGVSPLLLNKFLTLAKQREGAAAGHPADGD